ncbi:hypothetical protein BAUCODRAFT_246259 [Baudoinia panamericana UAMH 10762]|uniref:Uncharacterized protein n=1 Tax=Baudoinia panamericana (strain UAMH 10762) TaxID=717646 RepID=M2LHF7_BAUPA|nr:uncharacterized protein BAUCODRAFT_246259 [Baudoinia panamericana UAMH 10762]EMC93592.1 hypothetical protein BAUCODRAFT_246259 [Baudoinia panamericana UAMH 10762]
MNLIATALLTCVALSTASNIDVRAVSTTVVAVTATTTITQTATNSAGAQGACDNFYGACVVYIGYGNPSYSTTFYNYAPSTTLTTRTTTPSPTTIVTSYSTQVVVQTTTVSNSGECNNYNGACVVYQTAAGAATTVYPGSSGNHQGSSQGEIGLTSNNGGDGTIGAASGLDKYASMGFALVAAGFGALAFAF